MLNGVICIGEALIDFIPLDSENVTYQKAPGGAPANVSVGIAKLGGKAAFLGKVGNDVLGHFLLQTLSNYGVNTESMTFTDEARTGVTFVTLEPSGERDFSFYINPSADRFLRKEELDPLLFKSYKIFHFGSISLISEPSKSATLQAIKMAKEMGMLVSYDPNLRLGLWDTKNQAKETILSTLNQADILKISEEELIFLTGCDHLEEGIAKLPNLPLILVTLGGNGCMYRFKGQIGSVLAIECKVVDTTGAGDAFVSGILYSINESVKPLTELTEQELVEVIRFASVSGGLATTKKGAMTGLPALQEIKDRIQATLGDQ
ncbi:aminoimidazole riboside kinase [Niallia endozanthoxylica]|uniref:Aminoimidazole riboside kinase n=1 Tax=Niallia endozanthoxylica TaxID=2036016 RepID=A0A5J5HNT4_9BACI|nr:aminoimidazole riboside kinase [Niallia endozanthoxylica]KAA9021042.1 aminoimidazole riboside kinase [Niallia endozanthoxylica]